MSYADKRDIYAYNNILNPEDVQIRIISIDSRFRNRETSPLSTNFDYTFNTGFNTILRNIIKIRVASVEIPNMWYNFSETLGNTKIKIKSDGIIKTIKIVDGIYTSEDLINSICTEMKIAFDNSLHITFNMITLRTTICYSKPFEIDFGQGIYIDSTLGYKLGFRNIKYTSVQSSDIYTISSEASIDVIGNAYLLLGAGNLYTVEQRVTTTKGGINNIKCLAKIIVREEKGSVIYDDGSSLISNNIVPYTPIPDIQGINIKLMNCYGGVVDLNGLDFSFTLEITELINTSKFQR